MPRTTMALRGVIRGNVVELERESGLPDGQAVMVMLDTRILPPGLLEAFGAWSDDPEGVDEFVRQVYRDRESDPRNNPLP